jgi:hypothetical protein
MPVFLSSKLRLPPHHLKPIMLRLHMAGMRITLSSSACIGPGELFCSWYNFCTSLFTQTSSLFLPKSGTPRSLQNLRHRSWKTKAVAIMHGEATAPIITSVTTLSDHDGGLLSQHASTDIGRYPCPHHASCTTARNACQLHANKEVQDQPRPDKGC